MFSLARTSPATIAPPGLPISGPIRSITGAPGLSDGVRQVAAREQEVVAVGRLQPGQARGRVAVDLARVDHAAVGVDLLARVRRAGAGAGRRRRAVEGHLAEVVRELLEGIVRVEGNRRVLGRRLVAQADVVVDELSPDPDPLRELVLAEEVLAEIVEHAVADPARRRPASHGGDAVGIVRRPEARIRGARLSPRLVRHVVATAVEGPDRRQDVRIAWRSLGVMPLVLVVVLVLILAPVGLQVLRLLRMPAPHVVLLVVLCVVLDVMLGLWLRMWSACGLVACPPCAFGGFDFAWPALTKRPAPTIVIITARLRLRLLFPMARHSWQAARGPAVRYRRRLRESRPDAPQPGCCQRTPAVPPFGMARARRPPEPGHRRRDRDCLRGDSGPRDLRTGGSASRSRADLTPVRERAAHDAENRSREWRGVRSPPTANATLETGSQTSRWGESADTSSSSEWAAKPAWFGYVP